MNLARFSDAPIEGREHMPKRKATLKPMVLIELPENIGSMTEAEIKAWVEEHYDLIITALSEDKEIETAEEPDHLPHKENGISKMKVQGSAPEAHETLQSQHRS